MNKNILTTSLSGALFIVLCTSSCTKDFEKINTNPNSPTVAPTTNVLAYVVEDFASSLLGEENMSGPETYSGHIGKIQYLDESRYIYRTSTISSLWNAVYRDAKNAQAIINESKKNNAGNAEAVGITIQSYIFSVATDRWRDLPYREAIAGDSGYITPAYDKQEDIYPALIAKLKTAGDLFAANGTDPLGAGDLLYGGNVTKWRQFCNSLRLRLSMRLSNVNPAIAKANIEEILGDPAKYPVFTSNDDNAYFHWAGTSPYEETWFSNSKTRDDNSMGKPFVDSLKSFNDPRLPVYAKPATSDGEFRGVEIGASGTISGISQYSRIGAKFRDDPAGFSPFMNYSEVLFIKAEAALKGWNAGGITAKEYYENGVSASLMENGITDLAAINNYLNGAKVKWDGSSVKLYLQKWISLYKNGPEAWAEMRRTDVPLLPAAAGSPFLGHNRPPFRYPYPTTETTLNGSKSAATIAKVTDSFWGEQMWWDTRTGVH